MSLTAVFYLLLFFWLIFRALAGRPIYGLYANILTIYMYAPGSWWGGSLPDLRWSLLSGVVTLISVAMYSAKQEKELGLDRSVYSWHRSVPTRLLIYFVVWVWIQDLWAIGEDRHSEFAVMCTKFILLIYLINKTVLTTEQFASVLVAHLIGCAFFGYIGLTQLSGGRFERAPTPGMEGSNALALHMTPFLIASAYLLFLDMGKKKYLLIPFMLLTLNAIFLTQSRGAMAAIAATACISLFFIPKGKKKLFMMFSILAAVGAASLMGPQLVERLKTTSKDPDSGRMEASAESRVVIIEAQIEMFKGSPFLGYGHKGTMFLSPMYIDEQWMTTSGGARVRASHNLTMTLLVDHGLIGASLYLGAIFWIFVNVLAFRRRIKGVGDPRYILLAGCFLGLVDILIASQFTNSIRLEVGIWFIALCGVLLKWLKAPLVIDRAPLRKRLSK